MWLSNNEGETIKATFELKELNPWLNWYLQY
jgi:hypothetical protein